MRRIRSLVAAAAVATLLAACADEPTTPRAADPPVPAARAQGELDAVFAAASRAHGVPSDLLKSIGYVETRWQMVSGGSEFEGQEPAFGVMALRGANLTRGA
ncbi:MAG TPA: hypothetical protein VF263_02640, partial [Longimicrobiaceae bacterium]